MVEDTLPQPAPYPNPPAVCALAFAADQTQAAVEAVTHVFPSYAILGRDIYLDFGVLKADGLERVCIGNLVKVIKERHVVGRNNWRVTRVLGVMPEQASARGLVSTQAASNAEQKHPGAQEAIDGELAVVSRLQRTLQQGPKTVTGLRAFLSNPAAGGCKADLQFVRDFEAFAKKHSNVFKYDCTGKLPVLSLRESGGDDDDDGCVQKGTGIGTKHNTAQQTVGCIGKKQSEPDQRVGQGKMPTAGDCSKDLVMAQELLSGHLLASKSFPLQVGVVASELYRTHRNLKQMPESNGFGRGMSRNFADFIRLTLDERPQLLKHYSIQVQGYCAVVLYANPTESQQQWRVREPTVDAVMPGSARVVCRNWPHCRYGPRCWFYHPGQEARDAQWLATAAPQHKPDPPTAPVASCLAASMATGTESKARPRARVDESNGPQDQASLDASVTKASVTVVNADLSPDQGQEEAGLDCERDGTLEAGAEKRKGVAGEQTKEGRPQAVMKAPLATVPEVTTGRTSAIVLMNETDVVDGQSQKQQTAREQHRKCVPLCERKSDASRPSTTAQAGAGVHCAATACSVPERVWEEELGGAVQYPTQTLLISTEEANDHTFGLEAKAAGSSCDSQCPRAAKRTMNESSRGREVEESHAPEAQDEESGGLEDWHRKGEPRASSWDQVVEDTLPQPAPYPNPPAVCALAFAADQTQAAVEAVTHVFPSYAILGRDIYLDFGVLKADGLERVCIGNLVKVIKERHVVGRNNWRVTRVLGVMPEQASARGLVSTQAASNAGQKHPGAQEAIDGELAVVSRLQRTLQQGPKTVTGLRAFVSNPAAGGCKADLQFVRDFEAFAKKHSNVFKYDCTGKLPVLSLRESGGDDDDDGCVQKGTGIGTKHNTAQQTVGCIGKKQSEPDQRVGQGKMPTAGDCSKDLVMAQELLSGHLLASKSFPLQVGVVASELYRTHRNLKQMPESNGFGRGMSRNFADFIRLTLDERPQLLKHYSIQVQGSCAVVLYANPTESQQQWRVREPTVDAVMPGSARVVCRNWPHCRYGPRCWFYHPGQEARDAQWSATAALQHKPDPPTAPVASCLAASMATGTESKARPRARVDESNGPQDQASLDASVTKASVTVVNADLSPDQGQEEAGLDCERDGTLEAGAEKRKGVAGQQTTQGRLQAVTEKSTLRCSPSADAAVVRRMTQPPVPDPTVMTVQRPHVANRRLQGGSLVNLRGLPGYQSFALRHCRIIFPIDSIGALATRSSLPPHTHNVETCGTATNRDPATSGSLVSGPGEER